MFWQNDEQVPAVDMGLNQRLRHLTEPETSQGHGDDYLSIANQVRRGRIDRSCLASFIGNTPRHRTVRSAAKYNIDNGHFVMN